MRKTRGADNQANKECFHSRRLQHSRVDLISAFSIEAILYSLGRLGPTPVHHFQATTRNEFP